MKNMTTIQVEKGTRETLKHFGMKDETYDEILKRMIEIARRYAFFERQKMILREEEFVPLEKI